MRQRSSLQHQVKLLQKLKRSQKLTVLVLQKRQNVVLKNLAAQNQKQLKRTNLDQTKLLYCKPRIKSGASLFTMTEDQKKQVIESIYKKLDRAKSDIEYLTELTKPIAPENAIGRISRMDAINNKTINEEGLRKAKNKVVLLNMALEELNTPSFGVCKKCGGEIEHGRMMIMPEGKSCMSCLRR
jgi:DnaK suppressor protein